MRDCSRNFNEPRSRFWRHTRADVSARPDLNRPPHYAETQLVQLATALRIPRLFLLAGLRTSSVSVSSLCCPCPPCPRTLYCTVSRRRLSVTFLSVATANNPFRPRFTQPKPRTAWRLQPRSSRRFRCPNTALLQLADLAEVQSD